MYLLGFKEISYPITQGYSVILATSCYDMISEEQTMLISKISVDSNFTFTSYAWYEFQCSVD